MANRLKTACKGRKRSRCLSAKKSCRFASGTKRRYRRKSRNTRRNKK